MKSLAGSTLQLRYQSLPVRGAWIEIVYGARVFGDEASLPVRGAWIEIHSTGERSPKPLSLPVRGAWIEMGHSA